MTLSRKNANLAQAINVNSNAIEDTILIPSSNIVNLSGIFTATSGNFINSLTVNSTGVSISGHTHTSSDISNFNSSVSGLLPTIANSGDNRVLTSTGGSVGVNAESNLTFNGNLLSVTGSGSFSNNVTASGFVRSGGTSSQFLKADGSIDSTAYTTNVGTVTSVAALTLGTTGTDVTSTVATNTTTPVITLNIPTASASNRGVLSSTDWTTFNNKQATLSNPVTGTGTTSYLPKWTSSSGIGNSLIFDNGTGVAIGTTTPNANLTVYSTIYGAPSSGNKGAFNIAFGNTNGLSLGTYSTAPYSNYIQSMGTAGTTYPLALNPIGGNVGINTVDPSGKFHIESVVSNNSYVLLSSPGNVIKTHIGVGNSDSVPFLASINNIQLASGIYGWGFFDRATDGNVHIQRKGGDTSWSSVMMMDRSNGNVGIGISSPSQKLHVSGVIRSTSYITSDTEFRLNNATFSRVATMDGGGGFAGGYNVYLSGSTPKHSVSGSISSYYYYSDGTIRFYTNSSQSADTNASERLRITSAGNVGIGTATPSQALQVGPTTPIGSTPYALINGLRIGGGDTSNTIWNGNRDISITRDSGGKIYICRNSVPTVGMSVDTTTGDVGIGTITPGAKLHVAGDVLATGSFIAGSGSAGNPSFEFTGDPDTGLFSPAANTIALATSGVERLRINSIGNIGIGTSNPSHTLHVAEWILD